MATPQNLITILDLHGYIFSVRSNIKLISNKESNFKSLCFEAKCINHKILNIRFKLYILTQDKHKKFSCCSTSSFKVRHKVSAFFF